MKKTIITCLAILFLFTFCQQKPKKTTESKIKNETPKRLIMDKNTVHKDNTGKIVSANQFNELMQNPEYIFDSNMVTEGNRIVEIQLRKTTKSEMIERQKMIVGPKSFLNRVPPDFLAKSINGEKYKLSDLTNKVVVLNFWFMACPPCVRELPDLNKLTKMYENREDVIFLAPTTDEEKNLKSFLKNRPFSYNILPAANDIIKLYSISLFPTHIIIDKSGKMVYVFSDSKPDIEEILSKEINKALARVQENKGTSVKKK